VANFLYRIAGAAALDPGTYEDVEADETATSQAVVVIVLASLAAGYGASGWNPQVGTVLIRWGVAATLALLAWIAWALLTFEIGARLLPEAQTRTDVGELLRTIGFSAAPGLFLVLGALPGYTTAVFAITSVWMLAAMVIALRQALDYKGVGRALAVCSLGWLLTLAFIIVFGLLSGPSLSAQTRPTPLPAPGPVYDGGQLFQNHCATCHGKTGRGDGPTATFMRTPPADLTKFALNNGGEFPAERLRRIIDGRDVPSHGDRNMPVWGVALRTSRDAGAGYDSVEARIEALVRYIRSLQEKRAH
jgi:mono/diheme cytochrome c family protein